MNKVRVGIVGIGFGQNVLLPAFRTDARCEVVALCASRLERAQEVAARHGVPTALGDWRALLDDVDAVAIATPPGTQYEIASAALEAGKAVFCEKPLALTLEQARRLDELARRARAANMIDFEFLETLPWQRAQALIEAGTLGWLRHASITWHLETYAIRAGLASWKTSAEAGGGTLFTFISHTCYYVERLLGRVVALDARLARLPNDSRTGDCFVAATFALASGAHVSLSASSSAFLGSGHRVELHGDDGTLVLENTSADHLRGFHLRVGTRQTGRLEPVAVGEAAADTWADGRIFPVARLVRRFVDWALTGAPQRPNLADGLRVQVLLDAARRSDANRAWIDVLSPSPPASGGEGRGEGG